MARFLGFAVMLLAIVGLVTLVVLRGPSLVSSFSSGEGDEPDLPAKSDETPVRPPAFKKWDKPAAAFVLTGEQNGYLEPCGCSEKQSGGMARRSNLFQQLKDQGWSVVGLDLGDTVKKSHVQSRLKFTAITEALRRMDYRALGLAAAELRLQAANLIALHTAPADGSPGLSFLGANEVFFDFPGLEGGPKEFSIVEIDGFKVGVAMVLGESRQKDLFPAGSSSDVTFTPIKESLTKAVAAFDEAQTQFNVLLSNATRDESRNLAESFPQFQFILSAGGPEDPNGKVEAVGGSEMVTVGHKGKYAGVLAIYMTDNAPNTKFELVELNRDHFRHDTAMDAIMRDYQTSLKDSLSEVFSDLPEGFPPKPGEYVGADACAKCHKQAYAKWKSSGHANAYQSLIEGREHFEGEWVSRINDPECLSCHTTGWNAQGMRPFTSGFLPESLAAASNAPHRFANLQGQQCENCHGPGSSHVDVMTRWAADPQSVNREEQSMARSAMTAKLDQSLCIQCHDYENSPDFNFEEYWKKIDHRGMRN